MLDFTETLMQIQMNLVAASQSHIQMDQNSRKTKQQLKTVYLSYPTTKSSLTCQENFKISLKFKKRSVISLYWFTAKQQTSTFEHQALRSILLKLQCTVRWT